MRRYTRIVAVAAAVGAVGISGASTAMGSARVSTGALPVVSVAMTGKAITVTGALQSGAVQVQAQVPAKHRSEPMFIRLNPGTTYAEFFKVFNSPLVADPNNVDSVGAIVLNFDAGAGTTTVQTSLQPGLYIAFDSLGNNPEKWPSTEFTVGTATTPAALPKPSATMTAIEFAFRGPGTLHRGQLVRFTNHGFLIHMICGIRGKNAAGARQIARLLKAGKDNQASKLATGFDCFLDPASHGALQQERLTAQTGYWVLACFMDTQDGREHTQLGMDRVIRIVK